MTTDGQIAASHLYANILEEIKHRIDAINVGLANRIPIPAPFVREFCFLQIRMICELVALGCLVAHGDIDAKQMKSLRKEWAPDTIFKALGELHPDFFPFAVLQEWNGTTITGLRGVQPPALTKHEFLKIYGRCGDALHKGNVKKLLKEQIPTVVNYPEIAAIAQKLQDLLASHIVVMKGGATVFCCVLRNAEHHNRVQVAIAHRQELTPP